MNNINNINNINNNINNNMNNNRNRNPIYINENIQKLGSSAPVTELSKQLYLSQEGTGDVPTIQISKWPRTRISS